MAQLERKGSWDEPHAKTLFLQLSRDRFLPRMSPRKVSEGIFENDPFRSHVPPKKTSKLKGVKQAPYSDQPTAQGTHCREMLFARRVTEFPRSGQLFGMTYVFWSHVSPIFAFFQFFPHKLPYPYLFVHGQLCKMLSVIPCWSGSAKRMPYYYETGRSRGCGRSSWAAWFCCRFRACSMLIPDSWSGVASHASDPSISVLGRFDDSPRVRPQLLPSSSPQFSPFTVRGKSFGA